MLASHAVNELSRQSSGDAHALSFLADLGGWLTFASAMTMTLVLSETSIDYLPRFMFGERPELWVVGLITTLSRPHHRRWMARFVYVRTKSLRNSLLDTAEPTKLALRSVKVAVVGILGTGDRRIVADDRVWPDSPGLVDSAESPALSSSW